MTLASVFSSVLAILFSCIGYACNEREDLARRESARAWIALADKLLFGSDMPPDQDQARYYYFKAAMSDPQLVLKEGPLNQKCNKTRSDLLLVAAYTYRYPEAESMMKARLAEIAASKKCTFQHLRSLFEGGQIDLAKTMVDQLLPRERLMAARDGINGGSLDRIAVDQETANIALYLARRCKNNEPGSNASDFSLYLAYASLARHDVALLELGYCVFNGIEGFLKNPKLGLSALMNIPNDAPTYHKALIITANYYLINDYFADAVEQLLTAMQSAHFGEKDLTYLSRARDMLHTNNQAEHLTKLDEGILELAERFPGSHMIQELRGQKNETCKAL